MRQFDGVRNSILSLRDVILLFWFLVVDRSLFIQEKKKQKGEQKNKFGGSSLTCYFSWLWLANQPAAILEEEEDSPYWWMRKSVN